MALRGLCTIVILILYSLCKQQVYSMDIIDLLNLYMKTDEKRSSLNDFALTEYYNEEPAQVLGLSDTDIWKYLAEEVSGNAREQFTVNRRGSVQENVFSGACGVRPASKPEGRNKRIAVGEQSTKSWPWQAEFILRSVNGRPKHHCGGTLLNENYILTAAHCFNSWNKEGMFVRLGEYDREHRAGVGPYEQNKDLDCVIIHPDYKQHQTPKYLENDLALVKVSTPVIITDYVRPACLPEANEFKAGDECYVTGWGYTDPMRYLMKNKPKVLREAHVPLLSEQTCQSAYGDIINKAMVCAGSMSGRARPDSCKGDSGGPLVCQGGDGAFKLWGVVSWGWNYFCKPAPPQPEPTVYARVETFLKWIEQSVTSNAC